MPAQADALGAGRRKGQGQARWRGVARPQQCPQWIPASKPTHRGHSTGLHAPTGTEEPQPTRRGHSAGRGGPHWHEGSFSVASSSSSELEYAKRPRDGDAARHMRLTLLGVPLAEARARSRRSLPAAVETRRMRAEAEDPSQQQHLAGRGGLLGAQVVAVQRC